MEVKMNGEKKETDGSSRTKPANTLFARHSRKILDIKTLVAGTVITDPDSVSALRFAAWRVSSDFRIFTVNA